MPKEGGICSCIQVFNQLADFVNLPPPLLPSFFLIEEFKMIEFGQLENLSDSESDTENVLNKAKKRLRKAKKKLRNVNTYIVGISLMKFPYQIKNEGTLRGRLSR